MGREEEREGGGERTENRTGGRGGKGGVDRKENRTGGGKGLGNGRGDGRWLGAKTREEGGGKIE